MNRFYVLLCMLLLSAEASSNEISLLRRTREVTKTNVISLTFCESNLPAEEKMRKKTLDEVHTYAELKHDPRASLPVSFTVCSTIMATDCNSPQYPTFSNFLNKHNGHFLVPGLTQGYIESKLDIGFHEGLWSQAISGKTLPLFPNQWTRSCMAVNTTSGLIQWVVDGILVLDSEFVEVKKPKSRPRDLSKNIVLGALWFGGSWDTHSQKVTNLNIFSSTLTTDSMKSMTGGEGCADEGDYLAWGDMEWILHGQARMETIEKEEVCE